jgi:nucleoside-diphosphate-sugar epimerase
MTKILLAGASGNLGSHVQHVLGGDHEVIPLGRRQWADREPLARGVEIVINAAGDVHATAENDPVGLLHANAMLTAQLLQTAAQVGAREFFYVSSSAVYGATPTREDNPHPQPVTINGQTKLLNESVVRAFCHAHGIRPRIFRVFNMYGGKDEYSIVSKVLACAASGAPFPLLAEGRMRRDFIHVDDVAAAIAAFVGLPGSDELINIGTGRGVEVRALTDAVAALSPTFMVRPQPSLAAVTDSVADVARLNRVLDTARFRDVTAYLDETLRGPARVGGL